MRLSSREIATADEAVLRSKVESLGGLMEILEMCSKSICN